MLPEGALDRLQDGCRTIGSRCNQLGISQWEVVASQSYGHQIDIEGGKISLAGGGGEGGYGVRVLEDGKFGFAYLLSPYRVGAFCSHSFGQGKLRIMRNY